MPQLMKVARRKTTDRSANSPRSIAAVRRQARTCRDCALWKDATQTVFGEGSPKARVVLVGEQPGDQEDLTGKPFVGPAGRMLDRALLELGIDRPSLYVTNAVKHFKFLLRGKRRLHKKPIEVEINACHQWLERELDLIEPELVVAMGATAARAIFGRATAIERNRGRILKAAESGPDVLVTVHPSYLLRMPSEDRQRAYAAFVADLRHVVSYL